MQRTHVKGTTMNIRFEHSAVRLAAGETISVIDGSGVRIAAGSGRVWITQEHDTRDILLRPGQNFTLDRNGTAIVEALLGDAEIAFDAPREEAKTAPAHARKLTSLAVLGRPRAVSARDGSLPQAA
jgi:hypothetical protein